MPQKQIDACDSQVAFEAPAVQSAVREYGKVSSQRQIGAALAVFAVTLSVTLLFHLLAEPPRRALCFDARQYFSDTQKIAEFLLALMHGQMKPEILTERGFVEAIITDGPVFPSLFASIFAVLGHVPSIGDWRLIQWLQAAMHATSAALVFAVSYRLTAGLKIAVLSGLVWGLYPAAIFWSGIYYTETTVVFFALAFLLLFSVAPRNLLIGFACGAVSGLIALLKPALMPAVVVSWLSLFGKKKTFIMLVLGAALVIAPWALYTKMTTGHARFTANRYPAYNLAMGADTEVDGCYVWPGAPLTTMFSQEEASPLAFPMAQWQYRTGDCLRMALRKFSCLFGIQSNDFRQTFFSVPGGALNLWHALLVAFGFAGAGMYVMGAFLKQNETANRIGLALVMLVGGHFAYVLFTPTARYGFTAIPLLIIFAGWFLSGLRSRQSLPANRTCLTLAAVAVTAWLGLIFTGDAIVRQTEPRQVAHQLNVGDVAVKHISLAGHPKPKDVSCVLLLVDGDKSVEGTQVEINGTKLSEKLQHVRYFHSRIYDQAWDLISLGYPMDIAHEDFRQWRAVAVPVDLISWGKDNEIRITGLAPAVVYGDKDASTRKMLSLEYCCVNKVANSTDDLDPRIPEQVLAAGVGQTSQLSLASRPAATPLSDSLRVKFAVVLGAPQTVPAAALVPGTRIEFKPELFDLFMRDKTVNGIRTNKQVLKAARSAGALIEFASPADATHMKVKLQWKMRAPAAGDKPDSSNKVGLVVAVTPARGKPSLTVSSNPEYLVAGRQWNTFTIEDTIPVALLGDSSKRSLYFAAYPAPWLDVCGYGSDRKMADVQLKDITAEISFGTQPEIFGKRILFY